MQNVVNYTDAALASADIHNNPPMRTISDVPFRTPYSRIRGVRHCAHIGQYKLFLSELRFFNCFYDSPADEKIALYAGSAPGHHLAFLASMFPNTRFILIDPLPHNIMNMNSQAGVEIVPARDSLFYRFSPFRYRERVPPKISIRPDWFPPHPGTLYVDANGAITRVSRDVPRPILDNLADVSDENRARIADMIIAQIARDKADGSSRRFYIVEDYFANAYAAQFAAIPNLIYISDIRTSLKSFVSDEDWIDDAYAYPSDLDIITNNAMQHIWISLARPMASLLKFRVPFHNFPDSEMVPNFGMSIDYYANIIADYKQRFGIDLMDDYLHDKYRTVKAHRFDLQMFAGVSSTETRAVILRKDIDIIVPIDRQEYEEKMFTFNIMREYTFYSRNAPFFDHVLGIDGCANCDMMLATFLSYLQRASKTSKNSPEAVKQYIAHCLKSFGRTININLPQIKHGQFIHAWTARLILDKMPR